MKIATELDTLLHMTDLPPHIANALGQLDSVLLVKKPQPKPEPKVETVNLYSSDCAYGRLIEAMRDHRITFNLIDGEPDCTSIKMEKLQ